MDDATDPPSADRLADLVTDGAVDEAVAALDRLPAAPPADRKAALGALRDVADDRPAAVAPLAPALTAFLTDGERPVRLTTAKLFVALAAAEPDAVATVAPALAARLADEAEFYYVRARSAEALGYVAREHPDAVATPEVLADLRVGLSFDEPEVRRKLAKALASVALGDPDRLRHLAAKLAGHLDDDEALVRYHLTTALAVVACASPDALGARIDDGAAVTDALASRLDDDVPEVRGRAAEALGLLVRATPPDGAGPVPVARIADLLDGADDQFVAERARFALDGYDAADPSHAADAADPDTAVDATVDGVDGDVGTVEGIRRTTDGAAEAVTAPDEEDACPGCGLALPDPGPPFCPRCGAPR